jgi:hypothetical protein
MQWAITRGLVFPGSPSPSSGPVPHLQAHARSGHGKRLVGDVRAWVLVALLALAVLVPNAAKLSRTSMGEHAAYFDRRTAKMPGSLAGVLGRSRYIGGDHRYEVKRNGEQVPDLPVPLPLPRLSVPDLTGQASQRPPQYRSAHPAPRSPD